MISTYFRETCIIKRSKWFFSLRESSSLKSQKSSFNAWRNQKWLEFHPGRDWFSFISEYNRFHYFLPYPKKPKGVNVKPLKRLPSPGLHWTSSMSTWRFWTKLLVERVPGGVARFCLMMQPDPQSLNGAEVRNQGKVKELWMTWNMGNNFLKRQNSQIYKMFCLDCLVLKWWFK